MAITKDNFSEIIENNDIVLIDFWASWCEPCKSFAPVFEAVAESNPDITFGKINTEEEQELAAHFNIRSIPTLMAFREKVLLFSEAGALPESGLSTLVSKIKELDMEQVHKEIAEEQAKKANDEDAAGSS